MRSFCGGLLTLIVVLSISLAAAIAVAAILSSMAWQQDEYRPKVFAIFNTLAAITNRVVKYPDQLVKDPIKTRCACASGSTDENVNNCPQGDPCSPGAFPLTTVRS